MAQITFEVTADRLQDLPIGDILDVQENGADVRAQVNFLANFVKNGTGEYLEKEAGVKAVRSLTVRQLGEAVAAIMEQVQETTAPKA